MIFFFLDRLHEERLERERQLSAEHRRGLPPTSTPTSTTSGLLHHQLQQHHLQQHQAAIREQIKTSTPYTPTSSIIPSSTSPTPPISSTNSTMLDDPQQTRDTHHDGDSGRPDSPVLNLSKAEDIVTNGDDRDDDRNEIGSHDSERGMQEEDDRQTANQHRDEERLSEMDDDDVDKDECKKFDEMLME